MSVFKAFQSSVNADAQEGLVALGKDKPGESAEFNKFVGCMRAVGAHRYCAMLYGDMESFRYANGVIAFMAEACEVKMAENEKIIDLMKEQIA